MVKSNTIRSKKVLYSEGENIQEKKANVPERKIKRILKPGASDLQQKLIDYAFARCGRDCVETWQAESGWVVDRKSPKNSNGTRDFGICQQNSQYHYDFIFHYSKSDIQAQSLVVRKASKENITLEKYKLDMMKSKFSNNFLNPYTQLNRCISIWNSAVEGKRLKTTFYAYNVRRTAGVQKSLQFIYE